MRLAKGFTLIELLVVIAIIGILAAIIFPVYARVKDSAYRSSDMSNLNSIRTALELYRTDQGGFPPAILGYATGYMNAVPSAADIVPANMVAQASPWTQNSAFLYPKRVNSLTTLTPAYDRASDVMFTTAVWPQGITAAQTQNYQGSVPQAFGPATTVGRCVDIVPPGGADNGPQLVTNYYYNISGYDVANVRIPGTNDYRTELRYAPFWSVWTVPVSCSPPTYGSSTPNSGGSASDSPRQLGYTDPPETTVVTFDSFFREYDGGGNLQSGKREIVLFLGGAAKPYDAIAVSQQAWQVPP